MKFGETGDSIHALSFSVQEGYSTPAWPFDKTVKVLKAIDGTIIDSINFGARQHRTAEFNINYMTRADHYTLKTYFDANRGLKIRVELENTGERVFGEQYTGTVYYAYLLAADSMGETAFSPSHTMYGYSLKMDFAGTASNSVPNPADSSDYDILVTIDCVRVTAGCQVANLTALQAIRNKDGGSRGMALDTRKVYFYNIAAWTESGDNNNQLSRYENITGFQANWDANRRLYFSLGAPSGGASALSIFKDAARTQLIGHTISTAVFGQADGNLVDIIPDNNSGLGGKIAFDAHTAADTDIQIDYGFWDYQYTAPANDAAQGLKNGVFRLSAFADISGSSSGISATLGTAEDFKSGWIVEKSIKLPRYSVDARQGPAIEHPEGFAFALDNSSKRWKYPLDNNLAFYGAYCQLYVYDRLSGQLVLLRSGYNNKNGFDYTRFEFEIEPSVFLQNKSFPVTVIGKGNYPNAADTMRGKPVLATYGRWDKGLLQTVAFNMDPIRFPNKKKNLAVKSWNSGTLKMVIDLPPSEISIVLGSAYTSYPATIYQYLYVSIFYQQDQTDLKKLRKVLSVSSSSGNTELTLEKGFADAVDTTAIVVLYLSNVQILIDENASVGLREVDYLVKGNSGATPLELFAKDGEVVKPVIDTMFKVVADGKKNQLTVDTNAILLDTTGDLIAGQSTPLDIVSPENLHAITDKRHANGYDYFDFGFSPKGVDSNEVSEYAGEAVRGNWQGYRSEGRIRAIFSPTFTTLIWTTYLNASAYTLTRYLCTYRKGENNLYIEPQGRVLDTTFGTAGSGVKLENGSTASVSAGVVTIPGGSSFVAIDQSVNNTETRAYEYRLQPIETTTGPAFRVSSRGFNRPVPSGSAGLVSLDVKDFVLLAWPVPTTQAGFTVFQKQDPADFAQVAGMPVSSPTLGWYKTASLTPGQKYTFMVSINSLAIGSGGDSWFVPSGYASDHGIHQLLHAGDAYSTLPYQTMRDSPNCDLHDPTDLGYARSWGVVTKLKLNAAGSDFPAAGVVFSTIWKIDKEKIGDLRGAKDVRILQNLVVRSYIGANTPVPFIIQLRLLRADKSSAYTIQYENMATKAPTEGSSYGAYAQFLNLPGSKNGTGLDNNYETNDSASNAAGLYTGKDLWKLPEWLFEGDAAEWQDVEYLMISVTNAASIAFASIKNASTGYSLGVGGPPFKTWAQVSKHIPGLWIEYIQKIDGGLRQPLYARIDGGRIDDASGTITGTANKIIEKARHVVDHVVNSMLGVKPVYLGTEMKSRDGWLWRWQTKDSKPLLETLQTFANNIHGIWTLTPDDKLCLRSLDINDPSIPSVFSFTDSNIIMDSLGKPEYRRRNEIYQRFRLKYNIEPSKGGKPTEEILIGWDLATSLPVLSGYANVVEDSAGVLSTAGDGDGLDKTLCRLSTQLYAAGLGLNEFGAGENAEKIYEMFYRPTKPSKLTGEPIERDLPNVSPTSSLYGVNVKPPKMAMQDLAKMVVNFFCYDSWYFPISCSMKNLIYNPSINGVKDEAGTVDRKLKLGDVVTLTSAFHTAGLPVRCIILDIEPQFYDGMGTLHLFAPRPPGQLGTFVDPVWDAGAPGPRNPADFTFKSTLYGLLNEDGTFADAGGIGSRNEAVMKFPDGTFADPKGTGSGKA